MHKGLQSVLNDLARLEKRLGGPQRVVCITVYEGETGDEVERRISEYPLYPFEPDPLFVVIDRFAARPT